jgi:hypothetical protein
MIFVHSYLSSYYRLIIEIVCRRDSVSNRIDNWTLLIVQLVHTCQWHTIRTSLFTRDKQIADEILCSDNDHHLECLQTYVKYSSHFNSDDTWLYSGRFILIRQSIVLSR